MNVCPRCLNPILIATTRRGKIIHLDPKREPVYVGFDGFTLDEKETASYVDAFDQRWGAKNGLEAFPLHECGRLTKLEAKRAVKLYEYRKSGRIARLDPMNGYSAAPGYDTENSTTKGYGRA